MIFNSLELVQTNNHLIWTKKISKKTSSIGGRGNTYFFFWQGSNYLIKTYELFNVTHFNEFEIHSVKLICFLELWLKI